MRVPLLAEKLVLMKPVTVPEPERKKHSCQQKEHTREKDLCVKKAPRLGSAMFGCLRTRPLQF